MRKLSTIILILFFAKIYGQNTFPTSGPVGIGTTTTLANHILDVRGNMIIGASNDGASFVLRNLQSNIFKNDFLIYGTNTLTYLGNYQNLPLVFYTNNTERLRIDGLGNIGIGTLTPQSRLDVVGAPHFYTLSPAVNTYYTNLNLGLMTNTYYNLFEFQTKDDTGWGHFNFLGSRYGATYNFSRHSSTGQKLGFKLNTAEGNPNILQIFNESGVDVINQLSSNGNSFINGGNVGIGTTNPTDKLNILVGTTASNAITGLRIGGPQNYPSLELGIPEGGGYDGMIRTYGNDLRLYAGHWRTNGTQATENHAIKFYTSKIGSTNWDTPKMVFNQDGNLGIGTSNPEARLHIPPSYPGGTTGINDWARIGRIVFSAPWNGYGEIGDGFYIEGSTFKHLFNDYASRISFSGGSIRLMTSGIGTFGNAINWKSSFNIENNGNVGIGGVTPQTPLHVFGGLPMPTGWNKTMTLEANFPTLMFKSGNQKWAGIGYDFSDGGMRFWVNRNNDNLNNDGPELNIFNNGDVFVKGNLGLGISNVTDRLSVNGNMSVKGGNTGAILVNDNQNGGRTYLAMDGNLANGIAAGMDYLLIEKYTSGNANITNPNGDINFYTAASNDIKLFTNNNINTTFKANGQVVIGTPTTIPTDYKLLVAGSMIAEKVKVKKQSSGWPDFVFSPSYKLPNLTEVENFVKRNQHLPEIPSASEIEKEGQDLGEMNRLLLKKVEELTLYLIKQEKESNEQVIKISTLQKESNEQAIKISTLQKELNTIKEIIKK